MRRRGSAGIGIAVSLLALSVALGTAQAEPLAAETYFASDNVELVASVPLDGSSAGARIVGSRMFVITSNGLTIFDISDPLKPEKLGGLSVRLDPAHFSPEDVDTNGKILIVRGPLPAADLLVIDVSDSRNPRLVAEVPQAGNHTMTCVLDCAYAYGSDGVIVDLTKPSAARIVGNWAGSKAGAAAQKHDVIEVRSGIVLAASNPLLLLDARRDPSDPRIVSAAPIPEHVFAHGAEWPRSGRDRFLLVGGETDSPGRCEEMAKGELVIFDASSWGRGGGLEMVDEYRVKGGVFSDGGAPVATACGHWFDTHPGFENGGSVAMAWYEHGVRFLDVSPQGQIEELGYFMPVDGSTSAAYWVTDDIVYATDYNARGIDILRLRSGG